MGHLETPFPGTRFPLLLKLCAVESVQCSSSGGGAGGVEHGGSPKGPPPTLLLSSPPSGRIPPPPSPGLSTHRDYVWTGVCHPNRFSVLPRRTKWEGGAGDEVERLTTVGGRGGPPPPRQTTPAATSTTVVHQLLGTANAQTAHHATSSTAPTHQPLGSVNAETTPARAPAVAADRKQRPDATCEGKNG